MKCSAMLPTTNMSTAPPCSPSSVTSSADTAVFFPLFSLRPRVRSNLLGEDLFDAGREEQHGANSTVHQRDLRADPGVAADSKGKSL